MHGSGEKQRETIRPEFNPAIMIDFQGAKITSDSGTLRTGSKRGRTRCVGTRRVAVVSQPIRLGCLLESWRTTSCTCSGSSTSWARSETVD